MPWYKIPGCKGFQGVNWIHPWFQCRVSDIIDHTKLMFPDISHLIIFGSVTRDDCRLDSDIDICVVGDKNQKFYTPISDNTPYDVLWEHTIDKSSDIWKKILNEGVVVYGSISD